MTSNSASGSSEKFRSFAGSAVVLVPGRPTEVHGFQQVDHDLRASFHVFDRDPLVVAMHAAAVSKNDRCVVLPGASGSGKSTLVNMISGIDRPSAGEIIVTDTEDEIMRG